MAMFEITGPEAIFHLSQTIGVGVDFVSKTLGGAWECRNMYQDSQYFLRISKNSYDVALKVDEQQGRRTGVLVSPVSGVWNGPAELIYQFDDESAILVPLDGEFPEMLSAAIEASALTYQNSFAKCGFCKKKFPPEWRESEELCFGCASEHHGVIY